MIKKTYTTTGILIYFNLSDNTKLPFEKWSDSINDNTLLNVINDIAVNGIGSITDLGIEIRYENIASIDKFEYNILGLPKLFPFDIYIDIKGSGLKDKSLKIKYSFQDFAHKNGSGNILFKTNELTGAHLFNNDSEYLLSSKQYLLISRINEFNNLSFSTSNEVLLKVAEIKDLAFEARAVMSKIIIDTEIISPKGFKFDIEKIGDDSYKLVPKIENEETGNFIKKFKIFPRVKPEYSFTDKNKEKKVRVVIDETTNESGNSIKTELEKVKRKRSYSSDEINEIYNSPTSFWDTDIINLDDFGDRVLEYGIYKPTFQPFISPYKSQWLPGFVIDDKNEGRTVVRINNDKELEEYKSILEKSVKEGEKTSVVKGAKVDNVVLETIIDNAEKQLKNTEKPTVGEDKESGNKVLIIKENTEELEFTNKAEQIEDVKFELQEIPNLTNGIVLKDHQKNGVAWLQTLYNPPYNSPGVLLADDMGLGKTIQVLYFIEWYKQIGNKKPVLIVAPVSLLENWDNEYEKFFHNSSYKMETLWGKNVHNVIIKNNREQTIKNLSRSSIFLTTYETLRKQQVPLAMINWGVVILDEAQKVKTPGTLVTNSAKALNTDYKIAMTGTPVENSLMDLWCIIDFCSPGLLDSAKLFSKKYQAPLKKEETDLVELSNNLREEIGGTLMRRMKRDVAKDLPTIEYIHFKDVMPKEQYNTYINEINNIENLKKKGGGVNPVLQGIFTLRSISDHPFLKLFQLENIELDKLIQTSAKLKRVISILDDINSSGEKVIIFTENRSMQRVLRRIVSEKYSIPVSIINGETPTSKSMTKLSRQQEIDKYQNKDGFNAIVMSPIAAGFGLNITAANHVIHYTRHWNPAKEQQATDRAYRIGQDKSVKVYYPMAIAPNEDVKTFDEILNELLSRKSNLASNTLFPTEKIEISSSELINSLTTSDSIKVEESIFTSVNDLDKLNHETFEIIMALLFEKQLKGNSKLTPELNNKGANIVFEGEQTNLIQVKLSSLEISLSNIQELEYALNAYSDIIKSELNGILITNNYFSQESIEYAKSSNIELLDRSVLKQWISKHNIFQHEINNKLEEERLAIL
jgi:SNF2 family DNA or RNA helicase